MSFDRKIIREFDKLYPETIKCSRISGENLLQNRDCYDLIYLASRMNCDLNIHVKKEFSSQLNEVAKITSKNEFLNDLFNCKI